MEASCFEDIFSLFSFIPLRNYLLLVLNHLLECCFCTRDTRTPQVVKHFLSSSKIDNLEKNLRNRIASVTRLGTKGAPNRIFRISTSKATTPKNGQYVAGIKVNEDKIYLTIPRGFMPGGINMPVNLAVIDKPVKLYFLYETERRWSLVSCISSFQRSALRRGDFGADPLFRYYIFCSTSAADITLWFF